MSQQGLPRLIIPSHDGCFVLFVRMLSLLINPILQVAFEWSAVLFMVSSGHVCRQVVGRRSQVQTPTLLNPPSLQLFQHPPAFLLPTKQQSVQDLSALPFTPYSSSSLSCNTPEITFFTMLNSTLVSITSVDLMILGLLIFSPSLSFFKRITAPSLFDRFPWPRGQHFHVMLLPPWKMLTAV